MGLASSALNDKSQRWWYLSSIQLAGGIISIPVISIGSEVLFSNGIVNTLISILLGNLIILIMSYLVILMSYKNRLNAVENAAQFIGKIGGKVLAFFILTTMIGWVAWELSAGEKFLRMYPFFSKFSIGSIVGVIASLILLTGIKGLKKMSIIVIVPLLILFFIIIYYINPSSSINIKEYSSNNNVFDLSGLSLVISSSVGAVVDYPTFFRHSKTKKDALIAIVVIFIVTVIMQLSGVLLFKMITSNQSIANFISYDNTFSKIIVLFLILSMIASVCWNIYAASVGWESLFPFFKDRTEYALIGLVATVLISYIQLQEMLIPIATLSDAILSALSGVLIFEFISTRTVKFDRKSFIYNNLSWFISAILAISAYFNYVLHRTECIFIGLLAGFVTSAIFFVAKRIYFVIKR